MSATSTDFSSLDSGTRLAVERTRLAYERTLMAWVRTSASLISFGFTIYKFFQFELHDRPPIPGRILGPREFALIMIAIGLVSLLMSTIQHVKSMHLLRVEYGIRLPLSTATVVSWLFAGLGLLALIAVILRR